MALIVCPECGKECSNQATSCPHCGAPISKAPVNRNSVNSNKLSEEELKSRRIRNAIIGAIGGLIGALIFSSLMWR